MRSAAVGLAMAETDDRDDMEVRTSQAQWETGG
jgi:hypothetical protein